MQLKCQISKSFITTYCKGILLLRVLLILFLRITYATNGWFNTVKYKIISLTLCLLSLFSKRMTILKVDCIKFSNIHLLWIRQELIWNSLSTRLRMIKKLLLDLIILIASNNVIGKLIFSFKDIKKIGYNIMLAIQIH